MKKIGLFLLAMVTVLGFTGCGSSEEKDGAAVSTKQSTEDKTANETKKMEAMQKDLEDKGVEIVFVNLEDYGSVHHITFSREKSIDYDYFELDLVFDIESNEIFDIRLYLKGNIDGEKKDTLYYELSMGRIVEDPHLNTDINALAEVLESIDYSDQEMLEFAQWCYDKK
ncbi:hypothetical protein [Enterococcus sp. CWB-B31]|uniref:hypothetical protein n=1 Tax=Enterococcus sp. CWB-B31 TaxID=2885159 RepID=UPI001E5F29B4|nr:hypothetical protein [Enterococcus sp. CWB-B31]MCB5954013.1 hypothetical protein [Enterococcus sp. CWB-B31]